MEDETHLAPETAEVPADTQPASRIGPVAVWKMVDGILVPTPGYENAKIFVDAARPRLQLIETPKQPTWEEKVARVWDKADESFERCKSYFGIPDTVHDLSVDRFTARRLTESDYTAMVSLRPRANVALHPELIEQAQQYLQGRNTSVRHEVSGAVTFYFNVKDNRRETFEDITHFAYSFGYLSGVLPIALTYRYRNLSSE